MKEMRWRIVVSSCCLAALAWPGVAQGAPAPTIGVTGGVVVLDPGNDPRTIPGVFTWGSPVGLTGSNWPALENLAVHLVGPLTTPGITPVDREMFNVLYPLDAFPTDLQGNAVGHFRIPFDDGVVGSGGQALPSIPQPGLYKIYATYGDPLNPALRAESATFNLCPDSIAVPHEVGVLAHDWGRLRGGRDGWLKEHSPERVDPEWISVWSERPVGLYGTVAATNMNGGNQPAIISYQDYPTGHYAHDADVLMIPDDDYKWVLATANFQGADEFRGTGRIEWEWETQNSGSPYYGSYGHGNIGLPLFAMPTVGDRVYTVGHWALDNGHPDSGDRSEIHPARMIATMRKRNTVVPLSSGCLSRAAQVDVYVSGHGGGANQYTDGLEDVLDNAGSGGGRIHDFMLPDVRDVYEAFGPKPTSDVIDFLIDTLQIPGINAAPPIADYAGPSALFTDASGLPALSGTPWAVGPEERPVNDVDYDFDVPLPPAPAGAKHPLVQVTQYPWHTTHVEEAISYTRPDATTGLPTTAHVHLPYRGADNGIYARTLRFYWDTYSRPGTHFVVTMHDVKSTRAPLAVGDAQFYLGPQPLYLWTDVSGQWVFLTGLNTAGFLCPNLSTTGGLDVTAGLEAATFDVYLDSADTLRVFTLGYAQRKMDELFGWEIGRNAYDAGVDVASAAVLDTGDNQDLGGALYDVAWSSTSVVGSHSIPADPGESGPVNTVAGASGSAPGPVFTTDFTVAEIPAPPRVEAQGTTDFGSVCLGATQGRVIQIVNTGDDGLHVSGISISGGGYAAGLDPPPPYTLGHSELVKVIVRFTPTAAGQGVGALTVTSDDPCQPSLSVPLTGSVIYSVASLTGPLVYDILPVSDHAPGSTQVRNFSIATAGVCPIVVQSVGVTSGNTGDFRVLAPPAFPATIAPGGSLSVPVEFNPTTGGHRAATVSVSVAYDPTHPVPLTIRADGGPPLAPPLTP